MEAVQRLGDGWLEERSDSDDSLRYSLVPFEKRPKCSFDKFVFETGSSLSLRVFGTLPIRVRVGINEIKGGRA